MEKEIQIKTNDHKVIYGALRGPLHKPLIVLVHGLAGNMNETIHYNAVNFFENKGFSSFRFDLYSWRRGARKLHECTLQIHGKDIDTVLTYLRSKGAAKKIFILGHSYGFPSILCANTEGYAAVVSWDGSRLPHHHFDKLKRVRNLRGGLIDDGYLALIGEPMIQESRVANSTALLNRLAKPVKFITVDNNKNGNSSGAWKMYRAAKHPKTLVVIKGADHIFSREGNQQKLYSETVSWFRKYI